MVDWFAAARFLRLEAKRERERREHLGVSVAMVDAMSQALRIFDRPSLQAYVSMRTADTLDELAAALEKRARDAATPKPEQT